MITLKITHQHITVIPIILITLTNNDEDIMFHTTTTHLTKSVHISSSVQQQIYYTKFSFSWGVDEGREVILVMFIRMECVWVSGRERERVCYLLSFLLILSFITAAASHLVLSIYKDSPIQQQSNYLYLPFLWRLVYCRLVCVVTCNIGECAVRCIEDSSYSIGDVMNAWYRQHQQTIISR